MDNLKQSCPVCMEVMLPPIFQCRNGHLICNTCQPCVNSCPQCRDTSITQRIRNLALEKLIRDNSFQCSNKHLGCNVQVNWDDIKDHELDCKFGTHNFCKLLGLKCDKKTTEADIIGHVRSVHGGFANMSILNIQFSQLIQKDGGSVLPWTIKYDGRAFFMTTKVDTPNKCVSWMICCVGSSKSAKQYSVNFKVYMAEPKQNREVISTSWKGPVYSIHENLSNVSTFNLPLKTVDVAEYDELFYEVWLDINLKKKGNDNVGEYRPEWADHSAIVGEMRRRMF